MANDELRAATVTGAGGGERHIPFERAFNFRDLGGYRARDGRTVRSHRLFRAAALHRMTDADAERARRELGIVTVIDLRGDEEIERAQGLGPLATAVATRHHLPMLNPELTAVLRGLEVVISTEGYLAFLDHTGDQIAAAIDLLARDETYPAVFHCASGKDRTGLIAAFVLDVLGVDHATIIEDYADSERHVAQQWDFLRRAGLLEGSGRSMRQRLQRLPAHFLRRAGLLKGHDPDAQPVVVPAAMRGTLDALRMRHGSIRGYLATLGVQESTLDRLSALLLE